MVELETSILPPKVMMILIQKGTDLPNLCWHEGANRVAKRTLDETADDPSLLGEDRLVDTNAAAAARALLYLWNGWPSEAGMYAAVASEQDSIYVMAMERRQAGDFEAAKDLFRTLGMHPIYKPLAEFARVEIGGAVSPGLKRLREMIEFGEEWEPHFYSDVFEQAVGGLLDPAAEMIVRRIQCREFELLLMHCIETAIGHKIEKRRPTVQQRTEADRKADLRRMEQARRRNAPTPKPKKPAEDDEKKEASLLKPLGIVKGVHVLCPKCGESITLPEEARGRPARCGKCSVTFMVPKSASQVAAK